MSQMKPKVDYYSELILARPDDTSSFVRVCELPDCDNDSELFEISALIGQLYKY